MFPVYAVLITLLERETNEKSEELMFKFLYSNAV